MGCPRPDSCNSCLNCDCVPDPGQRFECMDCTGVSQVLMELFGVLGRNPGLPTGWAGAPLLSWNIARWVQDSPTCTGSCHSSTLEVTTVRSRETHREGLGRGGGEPEEPERSPSAAVLRRGPHTTSRAACAGPRRRHMCLTLGPELLPTQGRHLCLNQPVNKATLR